MVCTTCRFLIAVWLRSIFDGVLSLTSGQPAPDLQPGATSFPAKVVLVGFSVFGVIFLASYTASTAAALVAGNTRRATLETLDDVLGTGGKLCIRTAMQESFELRYPEFAGRVVTDDLLTTLLDNMDDGKCVAVVAMADAWELLLSQDKKHCNKMMVGGTIQNRPFAMPVRDDLEAPISYLVAQHVTAVRPIHFLAVLIHFDGADCVDLAGQVLPPAQAVQKSDDRSAGLRDDGREE